MRAGVVLGRRAGEAGGGLPVTPRSPWPAPSWSSSHWHLLNNPEARFTDLGHDYYQTRTNTDRKLKNHIRQIQALGFDVTITKAA
jgi:hypothetical protein